MSESLYPDSATIKEGLGIYFQHYGFNEGGYHDKWFKIKFWGPVALVLPNIKARVDAVKIHDVHHLITGYEATLRGEAEIGAWELAAGCGRYWVAWLLNFGALLYGLLLWPRYVYRAFMRGSRSYSLYHFPYDETLLSTPIIDVKKQLAKPATGKHLRHIFTFLLWALATAVAWLSGIGFAAYLLFRIFA